MKKKNILLFVFSILIGFVAQAQKDSMIVEEKRDARYFQNTGIVVKNVFGQAHISPTATPGTQSVFIQFSHSHHLGIADDEFTEQWFFMIPAGAKKSFLITEADLEKQQVVYCKLCYCLNAGCHKASGKWEISGKKKCKKWEIRIKYGEDINYSFSVKPDSIENFPK
jgi:hypothetical protein